MKRIHYGSMTIDTTDEIAELVIEVAHESANARHNRGRRINNGVAVEPFSVGYATPVSLVGYVDGGTADVQVSLVVGAGIAVAISDSPASLPDPAQASTAESGLETQLESLRNLE